MKNLFSKVVALSVICATTVSVLSCMPENRKTIDENSPLNLKEFAVELKEVEAISFGVRDIDELNPTDEPIEDEVEMYGDNSSNDLGQEETVPDIHEDSKDESTETDAETEEESGQLCDPIPEPEVMTAASDQLEMLACVIYQEAGADYYSDECRRMVADVVLNRIEDPRFPDTMEGVLTEYRQYGRFYWTGVVWPDYADNPEEKKAIERSYYIAHDVLGGNHSSLYGNGYIWQAEFSQGTDNVICDGIYFGR